MGNKDFEPSTLLTRNTYTLDQASPRLGAGWVGPTEPLPGSGWLLQQ